MSKAFPFQWLRELPGVATGGPAVLRPLQYLSNIGTGEGWNSLRKRGVEYFPPAKFYNGGWADDKRGLWFETEEAKDRECKKAKKNQWLGGDDNSPACLPYSKSTWVP